MTPTGAAAAGAGWYCSRFERRVALAPEPSNADDARRYALVVRSATSRFGQRLALVTPDPADADRHFELVCALAKVTNLLEPSETLAIDGKGDELLALVAAGAGRLAE